MKIKCTSKASVQYGDEYIFHFLNEKNMTQYRLEKEIAMPHNTMKTLMGKRNKSVNLRTIMQIAKGLNMTVSEFFDDPIFEDENIEID